MESHARFYFRHGRDRLGKIHHHRRAQAPARRAHGQIAHPNRCGKLLGRGGVPTRQCGKTERAARGARTGAVRRLGADFETRLFAGGNEPAVRQLQRDDARRFENHRRLARGLTRTARPPVAALVGKSARPSRLVRGHSGVARGISVALPPVERARCGA